MAVYEPPPFDRYPTLPPDELERLATPSFNGMPAFRETLTTKENSDVPAYVVQRDNTGRKAMRAIWNGEVIAESDDTVVVEGNHYFPAESVDSRYLVPSEKHTVCPWKGTASYHSLEVEGERNEDAAWYYPEPSGAASEIKDRIAFWRGVEVVPEGREAA